MKETIEIPAIVEEGGELPRYASGGAAGADVRAVVKEPVVIAPSASALIPTGLFFEIPEGYEIQVRPRSGLAFKDQVTVLNSPGTIDHDYRGELKVILINHGKEPFTVEQGMRIAQIIVAPVVQVAFMQCEAIGATERGIQGFGSTGTH